MVRFGVSLGGVCALPAKWSEASGYEAFRTVRFCLPLPRFSAPASRLFFSLSRWPVSDSRLFIPTSRLNGWPTRFFVPLQRLFATDSGLFGTNSRLFTPPTRLFMTNNLIFPSINLIPTIDLSNFKSNKARNPFFHHFSMKFHPFLGGLPAKENQSKTEPKTNK